MKETILVAGAGGFIGGHLVGKLLQEGHRVRAVDIKPPSLWYQSFPAAENLTLNLEEKNSCLAAVQGCEQVYNLAADMGGMGFIELNKGLCMLTVLINTHMLMAARACGVGRFFYSSSACVYAASKQQDTGIPGLKEEDAYPADPEDRYGWEKLFSERMCRHFREDFGLEIRVARYHNVYGPHGTFSAAARRRRRRSAGRSSRQSSQGAMKLKFGAMANRHAASCLSMTAFTARARSWIAMLSIPSTLEAPRW
jgi:nucleoside-diphosphate-sugar epimerase